MDEVTDGRVAAEQRGPFDLSGGLGRDWRGRNRAVLVDSNEVVKRWHVVSQRRNEEGRHVCEGLELSLRGSHMHEGRVGVRVERGRRRGCVAIHAGNGLFELAQLLLQTTQQQVAFFDDPQQLLVSVFQSALFVTGLRHHFPRFLEQSAGEFLDLGAHPFDLSLGHPLRLRRMLVLELVLLDLVLERLFVDELPVFHLALVLLLHSLQSRYSLAVVAVGLGQNGDLFLQMGLALQCGHQTRGQLRDFPGVVLLHKLDVVVVFLAIAQCY